MTGAPRVLAISSGGGHWVQLLRLRPAFDACDVTYACVRPAYADDVPGERFVAVADATQWDRWRLARMLMQVAWLVIRVRPNVVVSTGAAPGYAAIRFASWLGARTVWVDSIANVEELSLSGRKVGRHAGFWLTQWGHLARPDGPHFKGAVLEGGRRDDHVVAVVAPEREHAYE